MSLDGDRIVNNPEVDTQMVTHHGQRNRRPVPADQRDESLR
jgi:hypothetical protein